MSADNSKISAAGPSGPAAAAGETSRETGGNLRRESGEGAAGMGEEHRETAGNRRQQAASDEQEKPRETDGDLTQNHPEDSAEAEVPGEPDETDTGSPADEWTFTVDSASAGTRLDRALAGQLPEYSRSYLQKLTENGRTEVNGKTAVKCGLKLKAGDEVHIVIPEPEPLKVAAEPIPLDILYEDSDVIVVNKPKGMVVHPAAGHTGGTLVNALLYHCGSSLSGINGTARPGIVHRIDRDTTGVLIACKNDHAHLKIAEQLKEHSVTRRYAAIVCGNLKEDSGVIDSPIGRDPAERKKMACGVRNGKRAVTHWRVLERFRGYTYIECRLETGRTHQIRVHMASIGHPLLGDTLYGGQKSFPGFDLQGQTLHAYILGFIHPATGEYLEFTAPLPDYFADLLTALRERS